MADVLVLRGRDRGRRGARALPGPRPDRPREVRRGLGRLQPDAPRRGQGQGRRPAQRLRPRHVLDGLPGLGHHRLRRRGQRAPVPGAVRQADLARREAVHEDRGDRQAHRGQPTTSSTSTSGWSTATARRRWSARPPPWFPAGPEPHRLRDPSRLADPPPFGQGEPDRVASASGWPFPWGKHRLQPIIGVPRRLSAGDDNRSEKCTAGADRVGRSASEEQRHPLGQPPRRS